MATIQITIDDDKLQRPFGSSDGLKHLVEACGNQILDAEMTDFLGAEPGERTEERRVVSEQHPSAGSRAPAKSSLTHS